MYHSVTLVRIFFYLFLTEDLHHRNMFYIPQFKIFVVTTDIKYSPQETICEIRHKRFYLYRESSLQKRNFSNLPITAYCTQKCTNWQNFDSKIRRDHKKKKKKKSYECLDYESVDEKSLSRRLCLEKKKKKNQALKG